LTQEKKEKKVHLSGWVLFVFSAIFFIISSFRSGDVFYVLGSFLFLSGCLVFLIFLLADDR